LFEGFLQGQVSLGEAVGRSVMYVRGRPNARRQFRLCAYRAYQETGDGIEIEVTTVAITLTRAIARWPHDDATLLARANPTAISFALRRPQGTAGGWRLAPSYADRGGGDPDRRRRWRRCVVNGLYSIHIRMLDGVDGA